MDIANIILLLPTIIVVVLIATAFFSWHRIASWLHRRNLPVEER